MALESAFLKSRKRIVLIELWVAQEILDETHLSDGKNLSVIERFSILGQLFVQFRACLDFTCESSYRILGVTLREIHLRQNATGITSLIFHIPYYIIGFDNNNIKKSFSDFVSKGTSS